MSTVTIIIIVAIVLFILYFLFVSRYAKRNMNPIDSITFKGTMGILRGDSYKFVLSRLKHLNVAVEDNAYLSEMLVLQTIDIKKDYYALIHEVSFKFKHDKLESVLMKMNFSEYGIDGMFYILETRITRVLKTNPFYSSNDFIKWIGNNNSGTVTLSIMNGDLYVMVLPN